MGKKKDGKRVEKDIPYTIDAVLDFVSNRHGIPGRSRLSGRFASPLLIGEPCIVVRANGKDVLGIVPLSRREKNLKQGLMDIIEQGRLVGDVDLLEDVPIVDVLSVVVEHVDLQELCGWVSVTSNKEIMGVADDDPAFDFDFWEAWNSCGLKPKVKLGDRDHVVPSFSMMKELQSARLKTLLRDPLGYLLQKMEDEGVNFEGSRVAAFNVILQECRSFDWPAIVDGLVELLGGVKGRMEAIGCEVVRGLVIYKL